MASATPDVESVRRWIDRERGPEKKGVRKKGLTGKKSCFDENEADVLIPRIPFSPSDLEPKPSRPLTA